MSEALQDNNGNTSSMRLLFTVCILIFIGTWSIICSKNAALDPFTIGDALWFAVLFGGQAGQKFIENAYPSKPEIGERGIRKKRGIFDDDQGNRSVMRMLFCACVLIFLVTWSSVCFNKSVITHFTTGDALWFAVLFGGKAGQKYIENAVAPKIPTG